MKFRSIGPAAINRQETPERIKAPVPLAPLRVFAASRETPIPRLTHSPKPLPHVGSRGGGQWTVNRALVCGLRKSEPARPPAPHRDWAVAAGEILGFAMGGGAG